MNYKSKSASIAERLEGIAKEQGFEAARKLVIERKLGKLQQKEADSWLRKQFIKRNWWGTTLGIASIVGAVATVITFFSK